MTSTVSAQSAEDILEKYKRHPFAKGLLPFRAAMKSLDSPVPAVFAQPDGRQRWVVLDKATNLPAVFSYAAIYAQGDHMETGNYVPFGEPTPDGVDPKGVQARPNLKCLYTYVFDTYSDVSLYEGQWTLDDYISGIKGFNPNRLPRRAYLSGKDEKFRARFRMQTPVFLRRTPMEARTTPPGYLHDWVKQVDQESKVFKANPDRPRVWVKNGKEIVPISEHTPNTLQRGDVVAVSFTVTYHVTSVNWFAQFHPVDIIVVKPWDGDATDYSAPSLDLYNRPRPSFDVSGFDDGPASTVAVQSGSSQTTALDMTPTRTSTEDGSQGGSSGTFDGDVTDDGAGSVGDVVKKKDKGVADSRASPEVEQFHTAEGFELIGAAVQPGMQPAGEQAEGPPLDDERRNPKASKPGRVTRKTKA